MLVYLGSLVSGTARCNEILSEAMILNASVAIRWSASIFSAPSSRTGAPFSPAPGTIFASSSRNSSYLKKIFLDENYYFFLKIDKIQVNFYRSGYVKLYGVWYTKTITASHHI